MMQVKVSYFALLREQAGKAGEELETSASTAGGLYAELTERHGFTLKLKQVSVAINDVFGSPESSLNPGDEVLFMPPLSGG